LDLYVFASNNLTNIWAGVGAERWAVAQSDSGAFSKGRVTKAKKMPIGSFGILYCKETQSLTVPFVVYSGIDLEETVKDIWPEEWILPFSIKPLGTPRKQMPIATAKALLPSLIREPERRFDNLIHVRADFAFQTSEVSHDDWAILIQELAS
jgi:hypothetical protein